MDLTRRRENPRTLRLELWENSRPSLLTRSKLLAIISLRSSSTGRIFVTHLPTTSQDSSLRLFLIRHLTSHLVENKEPLAGMQSCSIAAAWASWLLARKAWPQDAAPAKRSAALSLIPGAHPHCCRSAIIAGLPLCC